MASPYIFQTTTCLKSEFPTKFAQIMASGGWTNVSSNAATDFFVFRSTGEAGDKNLVFQWRETSVTNTNPITTTGISKASIRLISGYVAGTAGAAGTITRTGEAWRDFYVTGDTGSLVPASSTLTIRYHVNKNRIMIGIEAPPVTGVLPSFLYVGLPDIQYCTESASRGLIFAQTQNLVAVNQALVTDVSDEAGAPQAASITRSLLYTLPPKNPNSAGKYHKCDVSIGDATEGVRFELEGLHLIPQSGAIHGDTLIDGDIQYMVFIAGLGASTGSFGMTNTAFALRIV